VTAYVDVGIEPLTEVLDVLSERIVRYRFDDQTIVYCNRAWALANGGVPDDFVGRSLSALLAPSEREGLVAQLSRLGPQTPFLKDHMTRTGARRADRVGEPAVAGRAAHGRAGAHEPVWDVRGCLLP